MIILKADGMSYHSLNPLPMIVPGTSTFNKGHFTNRNKHMDSPLKGDYTVFSTLGSSHIHSSQQVKAPVWQIIRSQIKLQSFEAS